MPQSTPIKSSRTQDVYEHLRAELMTGRLQPGMRLKINELCLALGVSLNAVREALSRLTSEGLVSAEPQRGFSVAPVSAGELTDLMQVRMHIEGLCLQRAIAVGDMNWEAQLVAAFHRLSRTPEDMADMRSAAHAAFHAALADACDSPWLLRLREMLYGQSERYRRLSISSKGVVFRDLNREHHEIMEAALARDIERACSLMSQHLELTTRSLLMQPALAAPVLQKARPAESPASLGGGPLQTLSSPHRHVSRDQAPMRPVEQGNPRRRRQDGPGMA